MNPLPFRVRFHRGEQGTARGKRRQALLRLAITTLTALGLSQVLPLPSVFGQTVYYYGGTLTATISLFQPIRSIILDTTSLAFTNCQQNSSSGPSTVGLSRSGNGSCLAGPVTVTLGGNVSSTVDVNGANATPDTGGGTWTLCGGVGPTCSNATLPSNDQYTLFSVDTTSSSPTIPGTQPVAKVTLSNAVALDTQFPNNGGPNSAGTQELEQFWLIGPLTTSNVGGSFYSTIVAWTVF